MPDSPTPLVVNLPAPLTVSTVESFALPENADLDAVAVALSTAPAGSAAVFDVQSAGTSLFAVPIGTVRKGATAQAGATSPGVAVGDTTIVITPGNAGLSPRKGQVITIDTEDMLVTTITGSYQTVGGGPEYQATVTRGVNGTTAATHLAGANVLPALPKVAAGATTSQGLYVPAFQVSPEIATGSTVAVVVTAVGSGTAGGGGTATLELSER